MHSSVIGYVLQEDSFLPNLTLRETLLFMAVVKLEREISLSEKRRRVDDLIQALGLEMCCNTIVGGPEKRGLSGGEKKRANIACEMLSEPSILLLDEPTSGLDNTYAYSMVQQLRNLCCAKGTAIVASIHQPSSELFHSFDSLLALSLGRTVYSGPVRELVGYLEQSGLACPSYYNPADHLMNQSVLEESSSKLRTLWQDRELESSVEINWKTGFHDVMNSEQPLAHLSATKSLNLCRHSRYPSSWLTQFAAILWRTFKNSRTLIISTHMFSTLVFIAFVVGFAYFQMPHREEYINDRYGVLFFLLLHLLFIASFNNLITFASERNVINKERASGLYHISAYYTAKSIAELQIQFVLPSLFFNIIYWMSGIHQLPEDLGMYFVLWLLLLLFVTAGSSVGSFFGAYFEDPGIALLYMPVLVLGWMLFAGYFSRLIPSWLVWLSYLSPVNYGFDAALQVVFTENMVIQCRGSNSSIFPVCNNGMSTNITGLQVLKAGDVIIDFPVWANILLLFLTIVLFRILAYLTLRYLNRPNNLVTRSKQELHNIVSTRYNMLKERLMYLCSWRHSYATS